MKKFTHIFLDGLLVFSMFCLISLTVFIGAETFFANQSLTDSKARFAKLISILNADEAESQTTDLPAARRRIIMVQ